MPKRDYRDPLAYFTSVRRPYRQIGLGRRYYYPPPYGYDHPLYQMSAMEKAGYGLFYGVVYSGVFVLCTAALVYQRNWMLALVFGFPAGYGLWLLWKSVRYWIRRLLHR